MTLRSSWKGHIRLSLVSVPVKAYPASTTAATIRLNQLHEGCHSRIKHQKVCPIHGEVTSDAIVSGYEYSRGQYVELRPDELKEITAENERAITIDTFLRPEHLDPIYLGDKTHYLAPDGPVGEKPYALLHKALEDEGVHATARVLLSRRERLVVIRPYGRLLTMTTLQLKDEVRPLELFDDLVSDVSCSEDELCLLKTLVAQQTVKDFDIGNYKDQYQEKLTALIEAKIDGKKIVSAPTAPQDADVLDIVDALQKSLAMADEKSGASAKAGPKSKRTTRKKASATRAQQAAQRRKASS